VDVKAFTPAFTERILKRFDDDDFVNSALTARAALIVTVHVEVPEHSDPLQPANDEPVVGFAVSVTDDPFFKIAEQSEPQLMPAGDEVTVPEPVPDFESAKLKRTGGGTTANSAATARGALIVTAHVDVPEHPDPLQPVNDEPSAGDAVSVTLVEGLKL